MSMTTAREVGVTRGGLLRQSLVITRRNLTHIKRMPEMLLDVTIQPVMFVLLFVYVFGGAIDTGEFADKSSIVGAQGLLDYLRTRDGQVMKTFSKKVLGYALGRTVMASDTRLINEMTTAGGDASFADLAVRVATSRQFRHHQGAVDNTLTSPL